MIKMITAYTEEVDEIEEGVAEILGQIDLGALRKNSVGFVTCHFDFVDSGFIGELSGKLPFDLIGMTTMISRNTHGQGMYSLSLTVLTSDEVIFETTISETLGAGDYKEKIKAAYSGAAAKLPGEPSLILAFLPYIKEASGALIHRALDEACGGIPIWGSLASNTELTIERCFVFRNGEIDKNGVAMILIHGRIDPEFIVVSLPADNIRESRGLVTASENCTLKEVNGITAQKYMENLGVTVMKNAPVVWPLMIYYEGSAEPVALAIYSANDDGSLECGGEMTKGASVTVGEITTEGILQSAGKCVDLVLKSGKRGGALFMPCVGRYLMLAPDNNAELAVIADKMEKGDITPFTPAYAVAYSGGEICPTRDEAGVLRNRFHNHTFSACVF